MAQALSATHDPLALFTPQMQMEAADHTDAADAALTTLDGRFPRYRVITSVRAQDHM